MKMNLSFILLVVTFAFSCSTSDKKNNVKMDETLASSISVEFLGGKRTRPPQYTNWMNISVHNSFSHAAWVIVPLSRSPMIPEILPEVHTIEFLQNESSPPYLKVFSKLGIFALFDLQADSGFFLENWKVRTLGQKLERIEIGFANRIQLGVNQYLRTIMKPGGELFRESEDLQDSALLGKLEFSSVPNLCFYPRIRKTEFEFNE